MTTDIRPHASARAHRKDAQRPIAIGSAEHKELFCGLMIDTHDPYEPSKIAWPTLDEAARARLVGLPFWNDALTTEDGATRDLKVLAEAEPDPLVRAAVALQAFEENRHRELIAAMCAHYGIAAGVEPGYRPTRDPEWAYLRMGYGECFDSFFAFGLFALADRSGYFPPDLVRAFEPVIQEEARHIVFFVNWAAWSRANRPAWRRPLHRLRCLRALGVQAWKRAKAAGKISGKDDFTARGAEQFAVDLNPRSFFELCLAENDRRMALYDSRLLRPKVMPAAMRFVARFMRPAGRGSRGRARPRPVPRRSEGGPRGRSRCARTARSTGRCGRTRTRGTYGLPVRRRRRAHA